MFSVDNSMYKMGVNYCTGSEYGKVLRKKNKFLSHMHQCATSGLVTRSGYYQFQETVPKKARAPPPATTGNIAMAHLSEDHKKLTRKILELNKVKVDLYM